VFLGACGGGPEYATVDQFFRAAQADDQPTLASMSAVSAPVDVESWTVVEATSRTTVPFALPDLQEQFEAAEKARDEVLKEGRDYLEEHTELDTIIPKLQEDPDYEYTGRMGEIQQEWMELVERRKEKERAYQEIRRKVNEESQLASKSVMNRGLTLGELDGEVAVTELLMNVKPADRDAELPYKVTLRRYDLANPQTDRVEPARWVIVDIEGTTEAARAAAEEHRAASIGLVAGGRPSESSAPAPAPSRPAPERTEAPAAAAPAASEESVQRTMAYQPKELRGLARVQILTPETRTEGNEVISTLKVRNASKDWISRFTATEYWYDDQGTATRGGSRTHDGRFMPGQVIELELRTRSNPNFYQNQFEFSHANGEVQATVVAGFPESED
jgi:hypothetical protein